MSFFPDPQTFVSFHIGSLVFTIRWYAVLILTGALIAYFIIRNEAKKTKYIDMDFFDSLFVYTLWAGILGARIWFCAFYNFSYYFHNPVEIIRIWDGGLAIHGGIFFGALFAYWYIKKNHYPFLKIADMALPPVLIAQSLGRWGNYVNKECHGIEVGEEYFDGLLFFLKDGMYINGAYYEPLFFYESILCLLGFFIIYFGLKKLQNKRGDLSYAYLMWYGLIRFFIEFRRTDSLYIGNIKTAQLTSIIYMGLGICGYLGLFERFYKKEKPTLIFDFDGTLIDTTESILEGYRALFRKYADESEFTPERQKEVIGPALKTLFPVYFPGIDYDTLYEDYHNRQVEVAKSANHPTLHSDEVLRFLHDNGYHIGIVSTRTKEGIERILDDFDLRDCVDDICGLRDVEKLKPDPEGIFNLVNRNGWYREVVFVGDTLMDMGCGNNYGAYTISYLSDPDNKEELEANSNILISDMEELIGILNQNINFTYDGK